MRVCGGVKLPLYVVGVCEGLPLCVCVGAVCEGLPGPSPFPVAVSGFRPCPRGCACFPPVTRLLLQHV